jgi:hypothetical protein
LWRSTGEEKTTEYYEVVQTLFKTAKREGAVACKVPAYDKFIIMPADDTEVDLNLSAVKQDMTSSQISRQLNKAFNNVRGGRIMAREFVTAMA